MANNENAPVKDENELENGDGAAPSEENTTGTPPSTPASTTAGENAPPAPRPRTRATAPVEEEKKKVEVDVDVLERLLDTVEKQGQRLKDVEAAADVGRLNRIQQARNEGKLVKNAKVSMYDNKVVLGWARIKDDVYFDEAGRLHEDQQVALYLDDGKDEKGKQKTTKSEPMSYRAFARLTSKLEGEVISERKDKDGTMFYTVQLEDGREYELAIVFIN